MIIDRYKLLHFVHTIAVEKRACFFTLKLFLTFSQSIYMQLRFDGEITNICGVVDYCVEIRNLRSNSKAFLEDVWVESSSIQFSLRRRTL